MNKKHLSPIGVISRSFMQSVESAYKETFETRAKYLFTLFDVPSDVDYYLDVGAGHCDDTLVFGKEAKQVLALDQDFWHISKNLDANVRN
jgi:hypothetical protein